jgi:hypothetical protein
MTGEDFRKLALALPDAIEAEHMGHPDFRVLGRVFATLNPEEDLAMVKLSLDDQESRLEAAPDVFAPCKGAWGRMGATHIRLKEATKSQAKSALAAARKNVSAAPAKRPRRKT